MQPLFKGSDDVVVPKYSEKLQKKSQPYLYLLPTVLLMTVILIIPICKVIYYSFFDNVIVNKHPVFIGLQNFATVLLNKRFWTAVQNTLFFVGVSVVAHMLLGILFAMLLNSRQIGQKSRAIFRVIYALPWMFTASVIAILWKMMMNPNGILNFLIETLHVTSTQIDWLGSRGIALLSVTLINVWSGYPFYMVSILAGLQGISIDLYEASAIDGANARQQFFRITLPQIRSILISLLLLDFVWTLQQFALIWMTTGGGPIDATEMLSTFIYKQAFSKYQYSQASASAVILLIVCCVIAAFYVRRQRADE